MGIDGAGGDQLSDEKSYSVLSHLSVGDVHVSGECVSVYYNL